ncbi:DEAD/DEAH box helicase [Burkholderia multivorans]|uniref:DEAD/DEAH box helicase n=1 Tax=Burkholderia multivorans TaxID=87883 RepID=UPI0030C8BDA4
MNISCVAAPPGARKTTAALNYIADHIRRGDDGEEVGFIFYVVPTRKLLQQSSDNLRKLVKDDQFRDYVREITSERVNSRAVSDRIHAALDGKSLNGMSSRPFVEGSVIFMTHQGFLGLKDHDLFARTTIVFDEARKWVSSVETLKLPKGADTLFNGLFEQQKFKKSEFTILRPRDIPHNKRASLITNDASGEAYAKLSEMHKTLSKRYDGHERVQIFARKTETEKSLRITYIEMPSYPFRGFREVIILSADFESSQMHHLLRYEEIQPKNITESFMNKWLGGDYRRCLQSVEARHSNVTILPLIRSDRMPSKYQAQSGILIARDKLVDLKEKMDALGVDTPALHAVVEHERKHGNVDYILDSSAIKLRTALREYGCELDILQWMIDRSTEAATKWWKKHGKPAKGVGMLNNDAAERGYVADPDHFDTISVGEIEGRNEFSKANVVCFLASINPDPMVSRLLNTMLGPTGYDASEDYIVDKAIQGIGRGNIRDHNSHAEMLAIVPTTGLAERLRARMKLCPTIDYSVVDQQGLTYWSLNEAASEEEREPESKKAARRQKEYLKDPLNAELTKLRKLRSKAKAQLAAAKTPEKVAKYERRIAEIQDQIREKTEERDRFRDAHEPF